MTKRTTSPAAAQPHAPKGDEIPNGGLEKIEAAEALGADPPNPGGTVIGGEGDADAQNAEVVGDDALGAEAPGADAAANTSNAGEADEGSDNSDNDAAAGETVTLEGGNPGALTQFLLERENFTATEGENACSAARRIIQEQDAQLTDLRQQLTSAERSIAGHKGQVTRAKSAGSNQRRARAAGCMPEVMEEEGRIKMREAVDDAIARGHASIVASDGEREVVSVEPVPVNGDPWRPHQGRRLFTNRVLLEPGDVPEHVEIKGFALLDGDKQVAWSPLADPVVVQPNTRVAIENAIAF